MPLPIPMGGKGAGGLVGILVVLALLFFGSRVIGGDGGLGIDPIDQFPQAGQGGTTLEPSNDLEELVSFVADDTQHAIATDNPPGTPSFYINGQLQQGVGLWPQLEPALRAAVGG